MRHTKGTWYVEETECQGKEFKVNTKEPRIGGERDSNGHDWICSVWTPKTGEKYKMGHRGRCLNDYKEAEANARLIASAPRLLTALWVAIRMIDAIGCINPPHEDGECQWCSDISYLKQFYCEAGGNLNPPDEDE